MTRERFELPTTTFGLSCSYPSELTSRLELQAGFEPATCSLQGSCTTWEFDRIRTCVNKSHNLAPKPLGHKLHINSRWIRTTTSRTGIWYATITPWSCFLVAPEGVEPSLTEPKPVVLPLYHRAIFLWNLVESNHVLRIFSPAHTPSLPKFPFGCHGFEPPPPDPESDVLTVTPWSNL